MEELMKILLADVMRKNDEVKKIETVRDLCKVTWDKEKLVAIFAANNGDKDGFNTDAIIDIANKTYQEVCENE